MKVNDKKKNTVHFNSSGTSIVMLFFLISVPLDAIGLAESRNKDLANKQANWIQFCENVAVSHDAGPETV